MTEAVPTGTLCAVHPDVPAAGACSNCGTFVCTACMSHVGKRAVCTTCIEDGRVKPHALPWEQREDLGMFRAWWMTVGALLSRPVPFFESLDPNRPLGDALRFAAFSVGMVLALFGGLSLLFCGVGGLIIGLNGDELGMGGGAATGALFAGAGVLYGFVLTLSPLCILLVLMAAHHPLMLLVGGGKRGFSASAQVGLYSFGFYPAAAIPCFSMLFILGILAYQVIGYSKIHDEPVWKASVAVFIPLSFVGLLYVVLLVFTSGVIDGFSI